MNKVLLKHLSFIWLILLSLASLYLFMYYPSIIHKQFHCSKNYIINNYTLDKIGFVSIFNQMVLYKNVILSSMFLFICGYIYLSKYYSANTLLIKTSFILSLYVIISFVFVNLFRDSNIFYEENTIFGCILKYLFFIFSGRYNLFLVFFISFFAILVYILKNKVNYSSELNHMF